MKQLEIDSKQKKVLTPAPKTPTYDVWTLYKLGKFAQRMKEEGRGGQAIFYR